MSTAILCRYYQIDIYAKSLCCIDGSFENDKSINVFLWLDIINAAHRIRN